MKIVIKQTDELIGTTAPKGDKVVEEFIVYLMDDTNRPLSCEIVYGVGAKDDLVGSLLIDYFLPNDWEHNKESFEEIKSNVTEEVSYEEYLGLVNTEL